MELLLSDIVNKQFATRRLLLNKDLHERTTSIHKSLLTPEKEPHIRNILKSIATQLLENPDKILVDNYTKEERSKDWASLVKKQVIEEDGNIISIDTRTRPGHKILDHHMPHFYDVKNYKGVSVRGLFTQEALEKALITNLSMHSTPYKSEIRRMLTMTGGLGNVTKYRTVTSKSIIQFYKAKRVLDPCSGWGGRLLGCLAAGDDYYYVACEPDPNTAKGLNNILADPSIPVTVRSRGMIIEKPFEIALSELEQMKKFDMILTSPPYFNLELYTAGEQSTNSYNTWDSWSENWLKKVILGCLSCLKEGGVSCWSVKNFKSDKLYPLADVTKKIHEEAGWKLVKTVTMTGSARPGGNRINKEGKEKRESEEETFCFIKV
jgi:hypothetical protein